MRDSARVLVYWSLLVLGMLLAGQKGHAQGAAQQQKSKPAVSTEVQGFSVKLTFSEKASSTLASRSETIIVAGYLTGFPKPGTPKQYVDHEGQCSLGEVKKEIALGAIATFAQVGLDRAVLKYVDDRGPQLLINVYSGRKSSPDNLLDCGIYDGPLQPVQGQSIPIACKLIGE